MPSDSHKTRLNPRGGPKPKCKQCNVNPADLSRPDKLCAKSCGFYADKAKAEKEAWEKQEADRAAGRLK